MGPTCMLWNENGKAVSTLRVQRQGDRKDVTLASQLLMQIGRCILCSLNSKLCGDQLWDHSILLPYLFLLISPS